jgi:hypothetical protein
VLACLREWVTITLLAADALQKHNIFLPEYLTGWHLLRTTKILTGFPVSRQAVENTFVFSCFSKLPEIYCLLVEGHFCVWSRMNTQISFYHGLRWRTVDLLMSYAVVFLQCIKSSLILIPWKIYRSPASTTVLSDTNIGSAQQSVSSFNFCVVGH